MPPSSVVPKVNWGISDSGVTSGLMPELLLEVGIEELPAMSVRRAYLELAAKIASGLTDAGLMRPNITPTSMGTPRRLIVSLEGLPAQQPDSSKEQRGPGVKAAYDSEGNPTQALLGFCRGQGVEPGQLRNDGQYVWFTKHIPGRTTKQILEELLPKSIRSVTFDKTMRWGTSKMRFARPLRWILAVFDGTPLSFDIEGVTSGNQSRGHRFYAPEKFSASSLEELVSGLRSRKVEADPGARESVILGGLPANAEAIESLLEENVFLTEWPTSIEGSFDPEFLNLPAPVLSTVMAKHEKMFPVNGPSGEITNRFVFVRNSGEDESVRKGCEWVLNARLNDAKFFFEEDWRTSLEGFLEKTKGILFQEKLGAVFDRSERLSKLAALVAPDPSEAGELEMAKMAGKFAKADLSTGLVSELASLQGVIGGTYAKREGMPEAVCWAIASQYDASKNAEPTDVNGRTAARLLMADQLDKLAGYLGQGLEPTGSSDPYGLRRAVTILIETSSGWPCLLTPFSSLLSLAADGYRDQGITLDAAEATASLQRLFAARYPSSMPGVRHDVLEASLLLGNLEETTSPQKVRIRAQLMAALAEDEAFVKTATRPINIVADAAKKGLISNDKVTLDPSTFESAQSDSARVLGELAQSRAAPLQASLAARNEASSLHHLRALEGPINEFFTDTMVMAEDPEVRTARLRIVKAVADLLLTAGDFSKLVFQG